METVDLEPRQKDYAVFLPALSGFYATFVGKQRYNPNYVNPARIPAGFTNGVESLNFLAAKDLCSAIRGRCTAQDMLT